MGNCGSFRDSFFDVVVTIGDGDIFINVTSVNNI